MKKILYLVLDLPMTIVGLIPVVLSQPYKFNLNKDPYAFVFKVKKLRGILPPNEKARAATIGHVILLGPKEMKNDFEHEIIHVKQAERYPLIYPFMYYFEMRKGYRKNRFEDEAYTLSNSFYEGDKK